MIQSKRYHIIAIAAIGIAILLVCALLLFGTQLVEGLRLASIEEAPAYVSSLFDGSVLSIDILAEESAWQGMLENATAEEYIMVDVVLNGTQFQNVGLRPKGNSSLTQVASSDSDRYSFRLQFDEYITGQTCFGLDGFVVNNMIGDASYMKEYISYEMMETLGVDAPCFGFASLSLNGEALGLYLAVELYGDSYEARSFGDTSGMLYNVKSMEMGAEKQGLEKPSRPEGAENTQREPAPTQDSSTQTEGSSTEAPTEPPASDMQTATSPPTGKTPAEGGAMGGGMGGGMGSRGGSSGGSLEYTDDSVDSYSAIFGNVVGKGTQADYERVIEALEALSLGENLERYFDVDQILRYLAVHNFVVNLDSYSSSMAQNYYIYERDGQLTILPWDYNLAWGGFQSSSASSVVNFPIDTPVSGVTMESRPLIAKLFENTEYLTRYHSYLQTLLDEYFAEGSFAAKLDTLDALIGSYVESDPTAFSTYAEYQTAVAAFKTLGSLRAQSVQGQLDGSIPSSSEGQTASPALLVDTGDLNLNSLGSMMGGRGGGEDDKTLPQSSKADSSLPSLPADSTQDASTEGARDTATAPVTQTRQMQAPPGMATSSSALSTEQLLLAGGALLILATAALLLLRKKRNY